MIYLHLECITLNILILLWIIVNRLYLLGSSLAPSPFDRQLHVVGFVSKKKACMNITNVIKVIQSYKKHFPFAEVMRDRTLPVSPVVATTGSLFGPLPTLFLAKTTNSYSVYGLNPRMS